MAIKHKIMNVMVAHPKLVTFAIGLGITVAIGTAIGMLDQQHLAFGFGTSTNTVNNTERAGG